jgi:predicted acetyltransferase
MSDDIVIAPPYDDADLDAYAPIAGRAFSIRGEDLTRYLDLGGRENFRLVRRGGAVVGGLLLIHSGHYFGGRLVPMVGVAAVAVDPCCRGQGLATALMRAVMQELHERGVALSSLYSAAQPLYRSVGYEQAGLVTKASLPIKRLPWTRPTHTVRPLTDADEEATRRLYADVAPRYNGFLDRNEFFWTRTRRSRGDLEVLGYGFERAGRLEGYIRFVLDDAPGPLTSYNLFVKDLLFADAEAGRSILAFVAGHATLAGEMQWLSGPTDPLLTLLPEQIAEAKAHERWMLRIVDVPAALRQRGYPAGLETELHLEVRDDLLPANDGRFVLRVRDGAGTVEPGGEGRVTVGTRALATLYAGHRSAQQLAHTGEAEGDAADLALASAIFAGPSAWMLDGF